MGRARAGLLGSGEWTRKHSLFLCIGAGIHYSLDPQAQRIFELFDPIPDHLSVTNFRGRNGVSRQITAVPLPPTELHTAWCFRLWGLGHFANGETGRRNGQGGKSRVREPSGKWKHVWAIYKCGVFLPSYIQLYRSTVVWTDSLVIPFLPGVLPSHILSDPP